MTTPNRPTPPDDDQNQLIEPVAFQPATAAARTRPAWLRPGTLALVLVLGALSAVAFFIFTGVPVQIDISPRPDSMRISGGASLQLGSRQLLRPGDYTVSAELDGYHPLETSIRVERGGTERWDFEMRKLPGRLQIVTDPAVDAEVFLDEGFLGVAPLQGAEAEPGAHRLSIRHPRYRDWSEDIEVQGARVLQTISAVLEPAWATVTLDTQPDGATVTLDDGSVLGRTPLRSEIIEGERSVELKLEGYKAVRRDLVLAAGDTVEVPRIALQQADGLLVIRTTPAGASVTVNGDFRGSTPVELDLRPGQDYRVDLFRSGYQRSTRNVSVASGRERVLDVALQQELGELRVAVQPSDAVLLVDDEPRGSADQVLVLSATPHSVEIRKDGYVPFRTTVLPRPGFPQEITLTLKTLEQARLESIKPMITTSAGIEMKLLRPTNFTMGTARREPGARVNEVQRQVVMTRPFYLATTETTNGQYRRFAAEHDSGSFEGEDLDDDDLPVVRVSWLEAALFCNWQSRADGLAEAYIVEDGQVTGFDPSSTGYRLPTEAEWAWAARVSGDGLLRFPWGDERYPTRDRIGNFADRTVSYILSRSLPNYTDGYVASAPVANYPANQHGIFDLGGNVAEWINDFYSSDSADLLLSLTDPLGPPPSDYHVIRGSSWRDGQTVDLRLAFREFDDTGRDDLGFRIARYLE